MAAISLQWNWMANYLLSCSSLRMMTGNLAMSSNRTTVRNKERGSYCFTMKIEWQTTSCLVLHCVWWQGIWLCPRIGRQHGIKNMAAIALQWKLNGKLIAVLFFIAYDGEFDSPEYRIWQLLLSNEPPPPPPPTIWFPLKIVLESGKKSYLWRFQLPFTSP